MYLLWKQEHPPVWIVLSRRAGRTPEARIDSSVLVSLP
ncbi:hypothetical protein SBA2_260059 [Acidobacteriia bacterium SbA2]|nr:hypothetical protein SBA2_260059 [Acidobacteriia bacterium SbA2]